VSVSAKRTRMLFGSRTDPVKGIFAALSVCSTRCISAASTFSVAFALDTCTAGDSP